MKKEVGIVITVIAVLAILVLIFFNITGYAVLSPNVPTVKRNMSVSGNEVTVNLTITSNLSLLAIDEALPKGVVIKNYSISQNYEVFEFKPSTMEWIISDTTKPVNAVLVYTFDSPVKTTTKLLKYTVSGKYAYVASSKVVSKTITGQTYYIR